MERFIAQENIRRFKAQLGGCQDGRQRETLQQLISAEERKLMSLQDDDAAALRDDRARTSARPK